MKTTTRSKVIRFFTILSVLTIVTTLGVWIIGGAHRGWTQTRIVEMHFDEITEIEYPVERSGFIPGIEVLGAGLFTGAILGAAGWITSRRSNLSE
ncbi:MAG TPA: hypothetical protein VK041_07105 [Opitutales bacterium]|nr:hypothetical protein [Opitutales bacterium]